MIYKDYRLGDIFSVNSVKKLSIKGKSYIRDDDIISKNGRTPYIAAISTNNGITGYSNYAANNEGDCITLSTTADSSNTVFYQEDPFIGRQQIAEIRLKDGKHMGRYVGLYMVTIIRQITKQFNYSNKLTKGYLENCVIKLPATESGSIDWEYMKKTIKAFEQDRVKELEQERVKELNAYLKVTGLNNYELTEEDKKILEKFKLKQNKRFEIGDLFKKEKLGWIANRKFNKAKDVSKEQTEEFDLPLVNAKDGNNGIMYYGRSADFSHVDGGIDIVSDGAVSTGNVYIQPHDIGVLYNAYIINLKNGKKGRELFSYLASAIKKSIKPKFNYSNKAGWDKVKMCSIILPIKTDDSGNPVIDNTKAYSPEGYIPDWDFMSRYAKVIEKKVIAEAVKKKDEIIEKTKEIVNKD